MNYDFFVEAAQVLLVFSLYYSIGIILASVYSCIDALINNGVITVKDIIGQIYFEETTFDSDTGLVLLCILLWAVIVGVLVIALPIMGIIKLLSKLNLKFIYNNLNKEVISTKSYKVKKLLYSKDSNG